MHIRVPGTVAKTANKFLRLHGLFCQVQEGHRCDDSPKMADETNCKILAQVCVGFNYIT